MDLALHLGKTVAELDSMTDVEFNLWVKYANRRMLPWRRMELYLAQLTATVSKMMGNNEVNISDYLFDPVDDDQAAEVDAVAFFAFNPRKKKEV